MDQLSLPELIQSKRNRLFLHLRQTLRFRRGFYRETGFSSADKEARLRLLKPEERKLWEDLEKHFFLSDLSEKISLATYEKNLLTLWVLGLFFPEKTNGSVLEVGAQDFSRAPALARFFSGPIEGLELDPYPVLAGFFSRADKASYYSSLARGASYLAADFFQHKAQVANLIAFYPFVSPHPALAWGLPAEFGTPKPWLEAIERVLVPGGQALVVHQGHWEEEEFDKARTEFPALQLVKRVVAECPFSPQPYPPHASLYRKSGPC
jgi:hypothetical protein